MNIPTNISYPKTMGDIVTGRSTLDNWLQTHYPDFLTWLKTQYFSAHSTKEMIYMFFNGIDERPKCRLCGNDVKFHGHKKGFGLYCCPKCAQKDSSVRVKHVNTMKQKYGDDYIKKIIEKGNDTKLKRYGDRNYNNPAKAKETCLERYGVDNVMKFSEFQDKSKETCLQRYGTIYYCQSDDYKEQLSMIQDKTKETCLERYGCMWNCMREEAHNSHNVDSGPNKYIKGLLDKYNIEYTVEYPIEKFVFDFKAGNTLIEVNPYATHNVNWSPFGNVKINKDYHMSKTDIGKKYGFRVINIWDWDDAELIIKSLINKQHIYARKCEIGVVPIKLVKSFLNDYHFQGFCKNQKYIYGLFYNGELVQMMSFGKPRYNRHYEYELIRLCTRPDVCIIGGVQRLFKYFIRQHNPMSVISYCDDSKFMGDVYMKLGFTKLKKPQPSKHWYKEKGNIHITDNLLRHKGYDKLFGTDFGKGTSNDELMYNDGFVEIYDAGQSTWIMKLKK